MANLYLVGLEAKAEAMSKFAHSVCFFGTALAKSVVDMVQGCRALSRVSKERKCG
jgi:hypothetical protein